MTQTLSPPPAGLAEGASLYLDFDGTLVEIAERPDAVVVGATLAAALARVAAALDGRIALISGRSIEALSMLLPLPGIAISGSHGAETRWPDGRHEGPGASPALPGLIAAMQALAAETPGVLVEEKPFGAALHYRSAPAAEPAVRALAESLARDSGFGMQPGKMVVELRLPGIDKGDAVRRLQAAAPFAGHVPLFVGDDDTDEAAFQAAAALGGCGILVGPPRATAARHRLDDVAAVHAWLGEIT